MFYSSSYNYEFNDCVSKGACSVSPALSSMQEVMLILLRQIAFYLLKLKEFLVCKDDITKSVISEIALIDAAKDLSELQILKNFSLQYSNLLSLRKEYLQLCREKGEDCNDLKHLIKLSPKTGLSEILKRGDKEYLQKYKKLSTGQKYNAEILTAIMKSVCVNLISLYEYGSDCEYASDNVLEALNIFNSVKVDRNAILKYTDLLSKIDVELLKLLKKAQQKVFGDIDETEVSCSTRIGKAILVSGSNLEDLKNVLEYVKESDIDVYTNGNLLIAHAFPYFKNCKNLKGHFGTGFISTILDFATFPCSILLTKNETQNIEYLYRGRLFTTDVIAPKGVAQIVNNDFSTLINSANQAKGFAKGHERDSVCVGVNSDKLNHFIDKVVLEEYKNLFIVGHSNLTLKQKDYFKKFFEILPEKSGVISFSYNPYMENVLVLNLGNDYPQIYGVLQRVFEKIPVDTPKVAFFLTKCDVNSLSNIINLKNEGAKNIFLSDCSPTVINPSVLNVFNKQYNINAITNPEDDLKLLK